MARLLQRAPLRGLGDDFTPVEVRFQQGASYPVDDLTVVGCRDTARRTLFVGCDVTRRSGRAMSRSSGCSLTMC